MTEPFVAAAHLARLKDFQRVTVQHVVNRMYDDASPTRRFLVADETGLGKSVVARGVIAEAVQRLLADQNVGRIDIVYVCSNADIAAQNLSRLNVVGNNRVEFRTRLTLLAAQSHDLNSSAEEFGKPVNLIAFTPATSFEKGWRTGRSEERALLAVLLQRLLDLRGARRTALHRALQGAVRSLDRFRAQIDFYDSIELDSTIVKGLEEAFRAHPAANATERLIDDIGHKRSLSYEQSHVAADLIGTLRNLLAKASVAALEPDLIILDEFQRFSHLLDIDKGGEAAELAHNLFEWDQARTLLLSATPYKPFTLTEEDAEGEDHYSSLMTTLSFLCSGDASWMEQVRQGFAAYRTALLAGDDSSVLTDALRELLLQYMCRTERPHVDGAHREVTSFTDQVTPQDLVDFVGLRQLARAVGSAVQVEYWKSAPYFVNFLEGYQVGDRLKEQLKAGEPSPGIHAALGLVSQLDAQALNSFTPLDLGNARLRSLADRTVGDGWWKLLWIPPSMPYLSPEGPYAEPFAANVTKQLVFSSWSATPTAIASLLSYEADRRVAEGSDRLSANTAEARRRLATALTYRVSEGRPGAMSTLALFWPHPALAELADPLEYARQLPEATATSDDAMHWAIDRLGGDDRSVSAVSAFFAWPGALPAELADLTPRVLSLMMQGSGTETEEADSDPIEPASLELHIEEALAADEMRLGSAGLAELALHSPGNVAWRAVGRLIGDDDSVSPAGRWAAAATIANGLRSLFNRVESGLLLAQLYPGLDYWRAVLKYVSAGNLQAVLDEYLHHLRSSTGDESLDDGALDRLAKEASATLSMRPSRYVAFDPSAGTTSIALGSRFALRYGSPRGQADDLRMPEVRSAFNSPFWPFVLTSTSVGQEGIDFHWWCHSVVHWNTPASPVDFEQREGRVNRFGGHAVRRNIALQHRADVMASHTRDPWQAAYDAASCVRPELGDFCPYWVYPGPYAVERHLLPFPLSQDEPRAEALKRDLTLYRLALGQPRQEDFLALLKGLPALARPIDLTPRTTRTGTTPRVAG
jgi:hypothetical protein